MHRGMYSGRSNKGGSRNFKPSKSASSSSSKGGRNFKPPKGESSVVKNFKVPKNGEAPAFREAPDSDLVPDNKKLKLELDSLRTEVQSLKSTINQLQTFLQPQKATSTKSNQPPLGTNSKEMEDKAKKEYKEKKESKEKKEKKEYKEKKEKKSEKEKKEKKEKQEKKSEKEKNEAKPAHPEKKIDPSTGQESSQNGVQSNTAHGIQYNFTVVEADQFETPAEAYQLLAPLLKTLANFLNKTPSSLKIYDPYFCTGSVVKHLNNLGFEDVYNKNEDFYEMIAQSRTPQYDVIVTNPPYSEDNIDKLFKFAESRGSILFALVPNYVYLKDWYQKLSQQFPLNYLVPETRFSYRNPEGKKTAPWTSFWYLFFPSRKTATVVVKDYNLNKENPRILQNTFQIPQKFKNSYDPNRKKERPEKRKKKKEELHRGK